MKQVSYSHVVGLGAVTDNTVKIASHLLHRNKYDLSIYKVVALYSINVEPPYYIPSLYKSFILLCKDFLRTLLEAEPRDRAIKPIKDYFAVYFSFMDQVQNLTLY